VNIEKLLLGAGTLGCEVARLLTVSTFFYYIPAPCHKKKDDINMYFSPFHL
jgi:hypothetical protein